ncbi:MAG: flagellin [Rhodocyclaceae bacterium]|nr:flagellin [Rhodocyclaceae bacterium]
MPQIINTNIASMNAQRNLDRSQSGLQVSLQRLSSGLRINSAKDDAAGLAISERMTAQIRGLDQARRNANDGVSLAQVGEGALDQMGTILQRVRELAVQSANATNSSSDRAALNSEVGQLVAELQRFALSTEFNGMKLLDGTFGSAVYQVGANANQTITATTTDFRTNQYGTYQVGNAAESTAVTGTSTGVAITGAAVASGGTVTLNGAGGSATITTSTADSARDIAAAINAKSTTGIRATARTETTLDFAATGSFSLQVFTSNAAGVVGGTSNISTVAFTVTDANTADGLTQAVNAFNEAASKTGITAKLNASNTAIVLAVDDGASINLGATTTGSAAGGIELGSGATSGTLAANTSGTITVAGQVTLDSSKSYSFTTSGDAAFTAGVLSSGTVAIDTTVSSDLKKVSELDVSTVTNATNALRIVDSALDAINGQRAKFGALQSRFETTIANLQTSSENLSAARSRIRDADFAAETANLTRVQILQQAGVAMLAQANALPQSVLQLLK